MNQPNLSNAGAAERRPEGGAKRVRGLVSGLVILGAGIAVGGWWFARPPVVPPPDIPQPAKLSAATKAVLQRLDSPVEIRFYSLLDPVSVGESGRAFSERVGQLLARYQQEAGGKLRVEPVNTISSDATRAALADGITPFNNDKGDACFLGLAVAVGGRRQSLAALAPEWEPALEADLSRAIAAVEIPPPSAQPAAKADTVSLAAVKQALPNLETVTVRDGARQLRATSMAEFKKTAQEMQDKIQQAEERFRQAQDKANEADQQAALKELQQLKREQAEKLKEIALTAKAQVEALQQLKGAVH